VNLLGRNLLQSGRNCRVHRSRLNWAADRAIGRLHLLGLRKPWEKANRRGDGYVADPNDELRFKIHDIFLLWKLVHYNNRKLDVLARGR
jgi:hypothetical protein